MPKIATQTATRFRLGVLGAGRLGEAIARTWIRRTGEAPLIWSRNGSRSEKKDAVRVAEGAWVGDWTNAFETESLVIAIPGKALMQLAENNEQAAQFNGNIFSASASLSRASLERAFPRATVFCISPFLIDGVNSIPMLVLRPAHLSLAKWMEAKGELELFGEIDVVEDEDLFSQLGLLGASWPHVVLAAVQAAANAGLQGVEDEAARRLGKRIFFRAIQSLLTTRNASLDREPADEIATPGGITERGLRSLTDVNSLFDSVFNQMQARAGELRA